MIERIAIDIYPLCSQHSGIGRSVQGLMSELPDVCEEKGITLIPFIRQMLRSNNELGIAPYNPVRLRLPRLSENLISRLGLVEKMTRATLFHATDFYLPLRYDAPMIASIYDVIYAKSPEGTLDHQRLSRAMKQRVAQCVHVITCSEYSANEFCGYYGYPRERVSVIPLGVDTDRFQPSIRRHISQGYFLAVSCNENRKNTPRLIRAFLRYAKAGGRHNLLLAWSLPESLAAEIEAAGMSARVLPLGRVPESDLLALYQDAICVMFPSLHEGFGFPVLEALACGVPIMTTRRSSLPEVGGDLALYVDGENLDEMTLQMLAFDRGDHDRLTKRVKEYGPQWARNFSWRRCAEETVSVYLKAMVEISSHKWRPLELRS
jgi:alpha-1,3-rhamnosyl/mannosyltransferase